MGEFNMKFIDLKNEDVKNYVEITPEQQAEIDKANEAQKKASQNAELAQGLSNKQPDLGKGVSIQKSEPLSGGSLEPAVCTPRNKGGILKKAVIGAGVGAAAIAGALIVGATGGTALLIGGAAILLLASCSTIEPDIYPKSQTGTQVTVNSKDVATSAINLLNDVHSMDELISAIESNYNEAISTAKTDALKQQLTETRDAMLEECENGDFDLSAKTSDGVGFEYSIEGDSNSYKTYITIPGTDVKISIPNGSISAQNVVDYIGAAHTGGNSFKTSDDVGYKYNVNDGKAEVVFDNGITHTVGDSVDVKDNSTLGSLYTFLDEAGFGRPENDEVLLNLSSEEGSFGNSASAQGFSLSLVTPANLADITSGNPTVKGSIGGVELSGTMAKDSEDNITITDGDNKVTISKVKGEINIGTEDNPDIYNEDDGAYVLTLADGTEYFMCKFDDGKTDIGKLHGAKDGTTTLQNYENSSVKFNTKNAADADDYYNDRYDSLDDAKNTASENYEFFNKIYAGASAQVTVG